MKPAVGARLRSAKLDLCPSTAEDLGPLTAAVVRQRSVAVSSSARSSVYNSFGLAFYERNSAGCVSI
jgi:hypothetical protein